LLKKVSDSSFLYDRDEILQVDEDYAEIPDGVFEIEEYGDISGEIRSENAEGIYEKEERIFENTKKQNLNKDLFKAIYIEWIVRRYNQDIIKIRTLHRLVKGSDFSVWCG